MNNMKKIIIAATIITILIVLGIILALNTSFRSEIIAKKGEKIYKNEPYGYAFIYDENLECDLSMEKIKTSFYNEDMYIEIFYDNFENTFNNSSTYTNYGNRYLKDNAYVNINIDETIHRWGYKIHVYSWERKKFDSIKNDKNYNLCLQYIKNRNEIYTVLIKSINEIDYKEITDNLVIYKEANKKIEDLNFSKLSPKALPKANTIAGKYYNTTFTDETPLKWGMFYVSACKGDIESLTELEEKIDYKFEVLLDYKGLFSVPETNMHKYDDRIVEYTLQFFVDNTNPTIMYDILDGKQDEKIMEYIKYIKNTPNTILFRLNNEMNGDWCSYNAWYTQIDAFIYREVWKYVYNMFEENEVNNIIWVWNPNWGDFPAFKWNHYLNYFPGEEYVDVIGVTGYNTGTYYEHETWRTFEEIYDPMMIEYNEYFDYRFMITEFGSSSHGGDKVEWINDMMKKIKKYNFDIAIWFSSTDYDSKGNPARIYDIDETEETINAFKKGIK